jgi:hypothetical protein
VSDGTDATDGTQSVTIVTPGRVWWIVFHGEQQPAYAFSDRDAALACLGNSVGGGIFPAWADDDDPASLRREIAMLKESRAAAVRQEQVSRNEANRLRGLLMELDDRLAEEHAS